MQLNLKLPVKSSIKSVCNPKPNPIPNLKAEPSNPNPNLNVVDNQLRIARMFVNNIRICRSSIGDHPNKV